MAAAKSKNTPTTTPPTQDAASNGSDAEVVTKPKRGRDPNAEVLDWTEDRVLALAEVLVASNGTLTSKQIARKLAEHPAFAGQAHLVEAQKVRTKAKTLSAANEAAGRGELAVKRGGNSLVDASDVLARVYQAREGGQAQAQPAPITGSQVLASQTLPQPMPEAPVPSGAGGFIGGLIPTPAG